jgi:hypothetical protein
MGPLEVIFIVVLAIPVLILFGLLVRLLWRLGSKK